ncbi:MAG: hypothetical protein IPO72_12665 [Saprospiraceae bacterium]|nr:hypothetical protein [Candidatus Vicinibacter affinis]
MNIFKNTIKHLPNGNHFIRLSGARGVELLTIRVPYDPILIAAVKKIQGVRWDPDHRVWKVPPPKRLAHGTQK